MTDNFAEAVRFALTHTLERWEDVGNPYMVPALFAQVIAPGIAVDLRLALRTNRRSDR